MNHLSDSSPVKVGHGSRGRGVFAARPLACGCLIESCPVITLPASEIAGGVLAGYVFHWEAHPNPQVAFPAGYGALYNHDPDPNVAYRIEAAKGQIDFITLREIAEGEELLVDYSYYPAHLDLISHPSWYAEGAGSGQAAAPSPGTMESGAVQDPDA